jgi:general secretion pathway protein G
MISRYEEVRPVLSISETWRRRAVARRRRDAGFTLVELLVVLAILGLLVALATPQVLKYLAKSKVDTARIEMANIGTSLDLFLIDNGRYPTQQEGLQALVINPGGLPGWHGPYIKTRSGMPLDPWGHPYQYRIPGQSAEYDLFTVGPDNQAISAVDTQGVTTR